MAVAQIPGLCLLVLLNTSIRDMRRSGPNFTLPEQSAAETRHLRQAAIDWCVARLQRERGRVAVALPFLTGRVRPTAGRRAHA